MAGAGDAPSVPPQIASLDRDWLLAQTRKLTKKMAKERAKADEPTFDDILERFTEKKQEARRLARERRRRALERRRELRRLARVGLDVTVKHPKEWDPRGDGGNKMTKDGRKADCAWDQVRNEAPDASPRALQELKARSWRSMPTSSFLSMMHSRSLPALPSMLASTAAGAATNQSSAAQTSAMWGRTTASSVRSGAPPAWKQAGGELSTLGGFGEPPLELMPAKSREKLHSLLERTLQRVESECLNEPAYTVSQKAKKEDDERSVAYYRRELEKVLAQSPPQSPTRSRSALG